MILDVAMVGHLGFGDVRRIDTNASKTPSAIASSGSFPTRCIPQIRSGRLPHAFPHFAGPAQQRNRHIRRNEPNARGVLARRHRDMAAAPRPDLKKSKATRRRN
ncbi:MAG: hypothetical protein R3E58_02755 [Phycisphaerae bacterium]